MGGREPSWNQLCEWRERGFTPRRRPFAVDPVDLLRPSRHWSWPGVAGLSIEQAFEAMAEIVRRAHLPGYVEQMQWGSLSPFEQIDGGSGTSSHRATPIRSLTQMREMFHHAYLGRPRCAAQRRWTQEQGIRLGVPLAITVRTYREHVSLTQIGFENEEAVRGTLARMLGGRDGEGLSWGTDAGSRMAVSLNGCHPYCRTLHGVEVHVGKKGRFRFVMSYGDAPVGRGSSWEVTIARSRPGESFLDTLARARDVHDLLVHGKAFPCAEIGGTFDAFLHDQDLWPWWIRLQVAGTLDGSWTNDERRPEDGAFAALRGAWTASRDAATALAA